jgi:hypothetical protein
MNGREGRKTLNNLALLPQFPGKKAGLPHKKHMGIGL